jgi:hypothetical protein
MTSLPRQASAVPVIRRTISCKRRVKSATRSYCFKRGAIRTSESSLMVMRWRFCAVSVLSSAMFVTCRGPSSKETRAGEDCSEPSFGQSSRCASRHQPDQQHCRYDSEHSHGITGLGNASSLEVPGERYPGRRRCSSGAAARASPGWRSTRTNAVATCGPSWLSLPPDTANGSGLAQHERAEASELQPELSLVGDPGPEQHAGDRGGRVSGQRLLNPQKPKEFFVGEI